MRSSLFLNCFFVLVVLTACSGLTVEEEPLAQPEYPPEDSQPSPFGFNKIHYAIPTGTPIVSYSPKGPLGLLNCGGPYGMKQGRVRGKLFPNDDYREIFMNTMESQGYDVAGDPGRMFDEQEDRMRAIYSVGARVVDVKVDLCRELNFWGTYQGDAGEAAITIEWSVFDLLHRRNVYKTVSKGYGERRIANYEGFPLLLEDAFAAAVHNLGADQDFYNLVFYGEEPAKTPKTIQDPYEEPLLIHDPNEEVVIESRSLSRVEAKGQFERIRKNAVLIQAANTHGSGFFITRQGHILTNAHVVGDASRVRVVTSGKKDKLVAEVLRIDRKRDVALLRLEDVPAGMSIELLPVRLDKPDVGEDTYAIGAPNATRLQDTITKGIVSAHRFDPREKQPYIQSDVAIYGGNSGGPLLDGRGNIIGLSVSGYNRGAVELDALNNFIPIGDGLRRIGVVVR